MATRRRPASDGPPPARVFTVSFRSATGRRRVARNIPVKVPYNDMNALGERLARAVQQGEILWFRIERPIVVDPAMRQALRRWPVALADEGERIGVTWLT
jgi:hypothetical protein